LAVTVPGGEFVGGGFCPQAVAAEMAMTRSTKVGDFFIRPF
jgi:hypothetical protein